MPHHKFILGKCRTVFFDLEYYVPEDQRQQHGLCYDPWNKRCKLLGGAFLVANPERDFGIPEKQVRKRTKHLWRWNYPSEKALVQAMYELLQRTLDVVHRAHNKSRSPILCGIGISTSDVLVLCELFRRYHILDNSGAFAFMNKFRVIDLSQLAIPMFNTKLDYLYPKVKNDLMNKYLHGKTFEDGSSVWALFDDHAYDDIERRVSHEIVATHHCYEQIITDIRRIKALEIAEKRRARDARRLADTAVDQE